MMTMTSQSDTEMAAITSPFPVEHIFSTPATDAIQMEASAQAAPPSTAPKRPSAVMNDLTTTPTVSPANVKRVKLSPEAKAAKLAEQEAKRAEREAKRAAKEEERRAKEAELAEKREQLAAKQKALEAERQAKEQAREEKRLVAEQAKREKEEAEAKKARAQPKLMSFFTKVQVKAPELLPQSAVSCFKPFQVNEHMTMTALREPADEAAFQTAIVNQVTQTCLADAFNCRRARRKARRDQYTLQQTMHATSQIPLVDRLAGYRYKLAQFHSDVRPPYFGTWTKQPDAAGLVSGRNPFAKAKVFNYDYDSEAEWEDDLAEGEDLGDEDDARSVGSIETYNEDDAAFLDDTETGESREARRTMAQMIPVLQGPFFDETTETMDAVGHLSLQGLIDTQGKAIDPFYNYWAPPPKPAKKHTSPKNVSTKLLATATGNSAALAQLTPGEADIKKRQACACIPQDKLPAFRKSVQGSSLNKVLLVEKLYQEFGLTKKAIQETLEAVAERQGHGRHDVWVLT